VHTIPTGRDTSDANNSAQQKYQGYQTPEKITMKITTEIKDEKYSVQVADNATYIFPTKKQAQAFIVRMKRQARQGKVERSWYKGYN